MATTEAERLVAALTAPDDAELTPLGPVKVGANNGTLTVSLPKRTARGVGIEQDDRMTVYHHPETNAFAFIPEEK
jgi:hypothetical protein